MKKRQKANEIEIITDADDPDDVALLASLPDQAESLLLTLEQTAGETGLFGNAKRVQVF